MNDVVVVLCTAPNEETAQKLCVGMVEARLAACVATTPIRSVYRWQGRVEQEAEVQLVIKTVAEKIEALKTLVDSEHPYDVPELIVLPTAGGSQAYLDWVAASCAADD